MQFKMWPVLIVALGLVFAGFSWPIAAQTADGKANEALAQIEKRLERIEKMLTQRQHEMKAVHQPKGVWQRIDSVSDKDPYIIILNSETGRVKFIDVKNANVYEK